MANQRAKRINPTASKATITPATMPPTFRSPVIKKNKLKSIKTFLKSKNHKYQKSYLVHSLEGHHKDQNVVFRIKGEFSNYDRVGIKAHSH